MEKEKKGLERLNNFPEFIQRVYRRVRICYCAFLVVQDKKLMKMHGPQEGSRHWFYLRISEGITEKVALEYLKEQGKDSQMNLNCQHFSMSEQFLQSHGNLR